MYLINKVNILSLSIILLISMVSSIFLFSSCNIMESYFFKSDLIISLKENIIMLFKLGILNLFIFIFGYSFSKDQDSYNQLIDDFKQNIIKYFVSKILVLIYITFLFFLFFSFLVIISGKIFSNWFYIDYSFIKLIINMLMIVIVYGLLSIIISNILGNSYSSFIIIFLFVFGEILKDTNGAFNLYNIYSIFFPSIDITNLYISSYGLIHLSCLIIVYFLISLLGYLKKMHY